MKSPSGPATASDFQALLAGINKLEDREGRDHLQTPGSRVSLDHGQKPQIPVNSPSKDLLRLTEVLDSIASFCVAQEKEEVVELGMEARPKKCQLYNCNQLQCVPGNSEASLKPRQIPDQELNDYFD